MPDSLVTGWMWKRVLGAPWDCQYGGVAYSQSFPWSVQAKPYLQLSQVAMTQPSCPNPDHSIREMKTGNWVSRWVRDTELPVVWPFTGLSGLPFGIASWVISARGGVRAEYWQPNFLEVYWPMEGYGEKGTIGSPSICHVMKAAIYWPVLQKLHLCLYLYCSEHALWSVFLAFLWEMTSLGYSVSCRNVSTNSEEWADVSEPPSSTKTIIPGPRWPPVPTPLSSFKSFRRYCWGPTMGQAVCCMWVVQGWVSPAGDHVSWSRGRVPRLALGTGEDFLKQGALKLGCQGRLIGLRQGSGRAFLGRRILQIQILQEFKSLKLRESTQGASRKVARGTVSNAPREGSRGQFRPAGRSS